MRDRVVQLARQLLALAQLDLVELTQPGDLPDADEAPSAAGKLRKTSAAIASPIPVQSPATR